MLELEAGNASLKENKGQVNKMFLLTKCLTLFEKQCFINNANVNYQSKHWWGMKIFHFEHLWKVLN